MPSLPNPQNPQDFTPIPPKVMRRLSHTTPKARGRTTGLILLLPLFLPYPHFGIKRPVRVIAAPGGVPLSNSRTNLVLIFEKKKKTFEKKFQIFPYRRGISKSTVGIVYVAAAFSTVFSQSSAPVLLEEQVAPEWGSRDKHGNDAGRATPSGQSRRAPVRGTQRPPARGKTTPNAASEMPPGKPCAHDGRAQQAPARRALQVRVC